MNMWPNASKSSRRLCSKFGNYKLFEKLTNTFAKMCVNTHISRCACQRFVFTIRNVFHFCPFHVIPSFDRTNERRNWQRTATVANPVDHLALRSCLSVRIFLILNTILFKSIWWVYYELSLNEKLK